ncbi:hypothetical protein FCL47_08375 [Desulfopila sp. IMCC35006]|uniref:hypothetical protein n=1 Tax=Desulfopila sp. IMCC35006 TaxID=2569542 RepID=UPI0010ABD4E6|nr:hypothetical protein [Desulfopila sp. IMCC35006]TKB27183.1 hypothetical protein FCL47_08375 [Desulfopila sp. IMCC35006]
MAANEALLYILAFIGWTRIGSDNYSRHADLCSDAIGRISHMIFTTAYQQEAIAIPLLPGTEHLPEWCLA